MRKFIPFFLLLTSLSSFAQVDSSLQFTQLETMLMEPGRLIKLETDTIGKAGRLDVGVVTAVDMNTGEKKSAICFQNNNVLTQLVFSPANLHLDIDELPRFIEVLTALNKEIEKQDAPELQTFHYTSQGLLFLRMGNRLRRNNTWDLDMCRRYKYINRNVDGSCLSIREKDLAQLLNLLEWYQLQIKTAGK